MSDNLLNNRRQKAVLWPATGGFNGLGEAAISTTPQDIKVRIEKAITESVDAQGNKTASEIVLNVGEVVAEKGLVWLGGAVCDLPTDLADLTSLYQITAYEEIPTTRQRKFDRCITLVRYGDSLPS